VIKTVPFPQPQTSNVHTFALIISVTFIGRVATKALLMLFHMHCHRLVTLEYPKYTPVILHTHTHTHMTFGNPIFNFW
jgi:hypothetical protein